MEKHHTERERERDERGKKHEIEGSARTHERKFRTKNSVLLYPYLCAARVPGYFHSVVRSMGGKKWKSITHRERERERREREKARDRGSARTHEISDPHRVPGTRVFPCGVPQHL